MSKHELPRSVRDQPAADVKNPSNPQYPTNSVPHANENDPAMPAHQDRRGSKGGSPGGNKP